MNGVHGETDSQIEVFDYPPSGSPLPVPWEGLVVLDVESSRRSAEEIARPVDKDASSPARSAATAAEQASPGFEEGREEGIRQGREQEALTQRVHLREAQQRGAEEAAHLASQFVAERDRFLENVEQEVVRLALAIAGRVLRREAQTDPLFLVGAVRVALGQLAGTLQVRLHVPAGEASLWSETLDHLPNLRAKPIVVAEASMRPGDCTIETEMGSVDLGMAAQLCQVECLLFDKPHAIERTAREDAGSNLQAVPL